MAVLGSNNFKTQQSFCIIGNRNIFNDIYGHDFYHINDREFEITLSSHFFFILKENEVE